VGFSLAIVFGGAVLMLLLGTQILNWYWLTLLALTAFTVSIVRIRDRMLTRYSVAQLLDKRLQLSDSLSTALFLLTAADRRSDPVARVQIEQAEQLAASVRPATAFPFRRHRSWEIAAALGAIACALFAVRYLVQSRLSFEQSLIPIHLGAALERLEESLSAVNQPATYPGATERELNGGKPSQSEKNDDGTELSPLQDGNLDQQANAENSNESAAQKATAQENNTQQNGQSENGASRESSQQRNPGDNAPRETREQANTSVPNTKEQSTGNQQSPSSLLEKMKEAASSLLAKMKSTANSHNAAQNSQRSSDVSRTEERTAAKNGEGDSPNAQSQRSRDDPSSDGAEQGQTREKAEASDGHNADQSPDKNGSDARSGIGRQNGDKESKEAEQLQAMGKLAEIIGKRSANLTGEVTVETSSGKQQLKTEYSQRIGQHSDLGGEINRDEIPLMYQQYIREYMERVHKQENTAR
jgi:hypothetical protein